MFVPAAMICMLAAAEATPQTCQPLMSEIAVETEAECQYMNEQFTANVKDNLDKQGRYVLGTRCVYFPSGAAG